MTVKLKRNLHVESVNIFLIFDTVSIYPTKFAHSLVYPIEYAMV